MRTNPFSDSGAGGLPNPPINADSPGGRPPGGRPPICRQTPPPRHLQADLPWGKPHPRWRIKPRLRAVIKWRCSQNLDLNPTCEMIEGDLLRCKEISSVFGRPDLTTVYLTWQKSETYSAGKLVWVIPRNGKCLADHIFSLSRKSQKWRTWRVSYYRLRRMWPLPMMQWDMGTHLPWIPDMGPTPPPYRTWDLPLLPPYQTWDIPPATDIWWSSLETCSTCSL